MPPTIRCKAILFDNDGVLIDSHAAVEQSWREWANLNGLDADKTMDQIHGKRARDTIIEFAPHLDPDVEGDRLLELEIKYIYLCKAFPGAQELLAALNEHPYAVVTSGEIPLATGRLKQGGITPPEVFITANHVTHGKPHPEGYLKAAQQLGQAPADCVVIEDSPAGLQAAKTGGMQAIGVATGYDPADLAAADFVIPSLDRLQLAFDGDDILVSVR